MLFILSFISILCFLLWVNMILTEFINARLNPYATNTEEEEKFQTKKAKFKLALLIIMSITISSILFLL